MLYSAKGHIEEELCSVIMPAYNSEKYIEKAIESVINQSFANWELIIVNDASTDNTEKIIEKYCQKDKRIKIITLLQNKGVANARNTAIKNAIGRYIAFLDSDDYWEKEKLKLQISALYEKQADLIYTAYCMFDEKGDELKKRQVKEQIDLKELLKENSIIFSSVFCKKSDVENIFFKSEWYHEDYVFLLDLLKNDKQFVAINQILTNYRVHKCGRSFNKLKAAKYRWKIYRKYLKLNIFKSIYYFGIYAVNGLKKYK